jgi:hypothetical protein
MVIFYGPFQDLAGDAIHPRDGIRDFHGESIPNACRRESHEWAASTAVTFADGETTRPREPDTAARKRAPRLGLGG